MFEVENVAIWSDSNNSNCELRLFGLFKSVVGLGIFDVSEVFHNFKATTTLTLSF